ncbi:MAG TPA: CdaR family protein [Candidatus Avamphibacillus sp.]|nr:CdaR family protein [Candidatus Avamphibacillus sp.]
MDKWFRSKWFVRIISLAFAIMLFTFVSIEEAEDSQNENSIFFSSSSQEMKTIDEVPVQIRIDNEQYVVSGVPEFVSVSLEGKTSTITPLVRQLNFDVFVDLEGLDEGEHTVEIQYENVPNDVSIYIEPKTIDVTIEEKASKEFSVTIDMLNTSEVPDGFELGTPVVEPSKVTITSSKSVIEQIAIVKVFVDVAGLKEPIKNREVPVNVYDGQGNELRANIEPENVVVSIPVNNPSKTVPINISTAGSLPDDFTLKSLEANLEEVEIFATSSILDDIDEINTEEIDLSKIEESGTVKTDLVFPDGVVSSGDSEIEVNVEIEQTRTIEDIPIDIENGEEGQEVSFLEPANEVISLTVVGNEEDVSVLKPEDFQVLINIGGLEEGEHTVPITIEAPDEINVEADVDEVVIEL